MGTLAANSKIIDLPTPTMTAIDTGRIERAMREILLAIGEDPDREGLVETPRRVAKAYTELVSGLHDDVGRHLGRVFPHESGADDLVIVRDIDFQSLCEHHFLPFVGTADVAYLPHGGRVVGLSKIARTVDVLARRPQMQERLTAMIADSVRTHLDARGVAVIVRAEHQCMQLRGARKQRADMMTTAFRGVFATDDRLRAEAVQLLGRNRER